MTDFAGVVDELEWLKRNPEFEERPATLREFLGADYLAIEDKVRKSIKDVLADIMGEEVSPDRITQYPLALFTGGIGIGKTTVASIVLPYLAHWTLCLRDPQGYFNLLPGSRIAFMQMSTSESQAKEVVFGDIKARVDHSPWFINKYQYDPKFKNQLRFPKDIWVLPGDSQETTFEGYNILGGILDEADSHKSTDKKDYAQSGYDTIHARITSRFDDRGFLLVIGQMKRSQGFVAKKFEEFEKRDDAYTVRMTIWDSLGPDHYEQDEDGDVKTFLYDARRKRILPKGVKKLVEDSSNVIEVPVGYRRDFENNPEKALRDLAGIPPVVGDAFISLTHKITEARNRWMDRYGDEPPVSPDGRIRQWFSAREKLKRVAHIDIAYSGDGDAAGIAMGHVREVREIDGERKPYIVIDFLWRKKAPQGSEIFLGDLRRIIYSLRDDFNFNINKVTLDGFQSTDTMQQLQRQRIATDYVSVDREVLPYHDLREALYEDRIEFPPYMTYRSPGDHKTTEILVRELEELIDVGGKIDHPPDGSKDVADAVAGVVYTLMGNRAYHKKVVRMDSYKSPSAGPSASEYKHPAIRDTDSLTAPLPPKIPGLR